MEIEIGSLGGDHDDVDQELLGRVDELGVLHGCVAEMAAHGRGGVVLAFGEAGIGKTALLRQFHDELPRRVTALWGTCDPLFTPRPLGPLLEPAAELGGEPEALLAARATPYDVGVALVEALGAITPAALIVEDVHWADEATLDVVRLLGRRAEACGFLLVLSYRSDRLPRDHPLRIVLGEFPAGDTVTRLELTGLSREAVDELAVRSGLDAGELFRRTAGNPFFVMSRSPRGPRSCLRPCAMRCMRAWRGSRRRGAGFSTRSLWYLSGPKCGCLRRLPTVRSMGSMSA